MSTSFDLRPARRADAGALASIRREAILALAAPVMGDQPARDWADSSGDERVARAIEQNEVWLAECEGAAVGWVEVGRDRVEGIYVRPDRACTGIGSLLLQHAEGLIRSAGHGSVSLDASPNAKAFYLRRGYDAVAERPTDAGLPMRKPLPGTIDPLAIEPEAE